MAEGAAASQEEAVKAQGAWFRSELAPVLRASRVPVYLIFGNSDCVYNYAPLKREVEAAAPHCRFLANEAVALPAADGPLTLFGFSLVPPSNHKLKVRDRPTHRPRC